MGKPRLWKVLGDGRLSLVSGTEFTYPPRAWTKHLKPDELGLCSWGYHYCEGRQILEWLQEGLLCEVEPCPKHKPLRGEDKSVSCRLRVVATFPLVARVLRLFACDCAERALLRERKAGREPDERSWEALRVAYLYAEGAATRGELAAAGDAAWDAARDAARDAAWDAAWDAAGTAAGTAAGAAAWDAERRWQYRQLLKLAGAL